MQFNTIPTLHWTLLHCTDESFAKKTIIHHHKKKAGVCLVSFDEFPAKIGWKRDVSLFPTWMSQEVSRLGYNPNISHF